MTDQLELFANNTEVFCKYPHLKRSSAYSYGCRCNQCVNTYREYSRKFLKGKRGSYQCDFCQKELERPSIYPVCYQCITPFITRTRLIKIPWVQVLKWVKRASCGICASQFNISRAGGPGSWQIDHDHAKGKLPNNHNYRDVLCGPCNSGIGALEANIRRGLITEVKGPFGDYLALHQSTLSTSNT